MIRNAIIKRTEGFECCVKLIRNEQRSRLSERKPNLTSTPAESDFQFSFPICAGRERRRNEQLSRLGIKENEKTLEVKQCRPRATQERTTK